MEKVDINLLPTEVSEQQIKQSKFNRVQSISIGILLLLILVTSMTVALRVIQSNNLKKMQNNVTNLEEKISSFKDKEAAVVVLKNRVNAIKELLNVPHKQTSMFNLITDQFAPGVSASSVTVDRGGNVTISLTTTNSGALEQELNLLTSDEYFKKIAKIDVESLAGSREGSYRVNLKIFPIK